MACSLRFAFVLVLASSVSSATVVTYPAPSKIFPSGPFSINVSESSAKAPQPSFVYISKAPTNGPGAQKGRTMSWTTFSFAGSVSIAVTPKKTWKSVTLRPASLKLKVTRVGDAAVFTLTKPAKVVAEFDGDAKDSLMVFGDALEEEVPLRAGDVQFGPGVHDIGQSYTVAKGARVHIAGGAWVRGTFASTLFAPATGVIIEGRGVLSGEKLAHPSSATDDLAMVNLCGDDITVRGITIANPPTYMVNVNPYWKVCFQQRSLIENVKALGWHYTSDGIMVGRNSIVRDNFVRANDDALKLYMSNTLWERNTIWQEDNGQSFMLSWNTMTDESNITVRDCTVVHVEHRGDGASGARSVFGAVHGGTAHLSGYHFEDIVVEGHVFRPFGITVQKSQFGVTDKGSIKDVTFRNIVFSGVTGKTNKISGTVSNVAFHDLSLQGQVITSASQGHFTLGANTSDVTFNSNTLALV